MSIPEASLPPLREVINRYGLAAKRSLGQHFLLDLNLTARIARSGGRLEGELVIEVGPGPGGLTRALLAEGARKVVAIERDRRCLDALAQVAAHYPGRLEVIEGDALETDFAAIVAQDEGAYALIVKVIDIPAAAPGMRARVIADPESRSAVCFLDAES